MKFLTLFVICVWFKESRRAWFITIRFHEVLSFIRTLLIVMKRKRAAGFAGQSFRSDWAVPTGGVFDSVKEAGFPSFSLPPPEDIHNKDDHNDEIDDETNGENVVPAGRGKNLEN